MKIGITGNIAAGKSEVETIIKDSGFIVYDLDKITHELYENESIKSQLVKVFNTSNRNEISKIVFNSKEKMKLLEAIIHPELKNFIQSIDDKKLVFISGALIYEANFDTYFNKIIFVTAPKDLRLKRLIKRNNYTEAEALKRIEFQSSNYHDKADFIISNDTTIEDLKTKVQEILTKLQ